MALRNDNSVEAEMAWWQVVSEMHKAGEPIDDRTQRGMVQKYFSSFNSDLQLTHLQTAVPPADQAELARMLVASGKLDSGETLAVKANMAVALEAAGKSADALTAWRDVQSTGEAGRTYNFTSHMNEALKRLGGPSTQRH
jgi:hypothetical protein